MLVVVFAITSYQQRNMTTGPAPELAGIDYSDGPTLVYFWGSWCPVCKTTSPFVSTLAHENSLAQEDAGAQIISIALSSGSDNEINDYLQEHGYQFDTLNDDNGQVSKQWGVAVTPSIFIINAKGEIRYTSTGMTSLWGMKLRLWLASL
jgi:thiol-disulfide isomerase/thioredoxin